MDGSLAKSWKVGDAVTVFQAEAAELRLGEVLRDQDDGSLKYCATGES